MLTPQLIQKFETGLDTDETPYIAPPDAFIELENFHVHHGYVEKRSGSNLLGYMVYPTNDGGSSVGIDDITEAMNEEDPSIVTTVEPHGLVDGDQVVFNNVSGMDQINFLRFEISSSTPTTFEIFGTYGFDAYTSGGIVNVAPTTTIMGITRFINIDNTYDTIIFDNARAAIYNETTHVFDPLNADEEIFADMGESDYVWTFQMQTPSEALNRLYITNGLPRDDDRNGILFYPKSEAEPNDIGSLVPPLDSTGTDRTMVGAKLIFTLGSRLLALNTYEDEDGDVIHYPQRARYCKFLNPGEETWRETPGVGGFLDAPTADHIISGRALKDSIVVFFTNSVWVLRYSIGDAVAPFRWYKLNDFRACGGKMASVGYDQYVISLGKRGIVSTDYTQTIRIDEKISEFVINEVNSANFDKVFCERSYGEQRWWTLYPKTSSSDDTQNKGVLIYDDDSGAYSTYDFPLNVLGVGNLTYDYTWQQFNAQNNLDLTWGEITETWDSNTWQFDGECLLGGDTTGAIYNLEQRGSDAGESISSVFKTVYWSPFKEDGRESQMSYIDLYLDSQYTTMATIEFFKDDAMDPYSSQKIDMLPDLGYLATITSITLGNPTIITAPGHGLSTGNTIFMYLITGTIELNDRAFVVTVIDNNSFSIAENSTSYGAYEAQTGQVVLREFYTTKVWKRAFAGGIGYQHAIRVSTSGTNTPMRLYSLKPYFKPRGKRTIN